MTHVAGSGARLLVGVVDGRVGLHEVDLVFGVLVLLRVFPLQGKEAKICSSICHMCWLAVHPSVPKLLKLTESTELTTNKIERASL